jgi:hypothetical protein
LTHASFARKADVNVFSQFGTGSSSGRKWRLKTKIVKHTDIAPRVKIKARYIAGKKTRKYTINDTT